MEDAVAISPDEQIGTVVPPQSDGVIGITITTDIFIGSDKGSIEKKGAAQFASQNGQALAPTTKNGLSVIADPSGPSASNPSGSQSFEIDASKFLVLSAIVPRGAADHDAGAHDILWRSLGSVTFSNAVGVIPTLVENPDLSITPTNKSNTGFAFTAGLALLLLLHPCGSRSGALVELDLKTAPGGASRTF